MDRGEEDQGSRSYAGGWCQALDRCGCQPGLEVEAAQVSPKGQTEEASLKEAKPRGACNTERLLTE